MKRAILSIFATATLLVGCDKGFEKVSEPTLELSTAMTTYFTQEPVVFNIESNANILSFYSGERGNDYAYAKQERIYEGEAFLSFNTAFQAGAQWKNQLESDPELKILRLFYSTDFSGLYTMEAIEQATWHELTDAFSYPTARSTNAKVLSQTTESGVRAVADLIPAEELDGPIYLAFRYKIDGYDADLNNARSRASVMNFNLYTRCEEINATANLATQATAGWQLVMQGYEGDSGNYAPEVTSTMIWFDCDGGMPNEHICWAVSSPLVINNEVNIGCDYGVGIKSFAGEPITSYTYTYAEPGIYDVYVTAANVDHEGSRMEKTASVRVEIVDQGSADVEQPDQGEW